MLSRTKRIFLIFLFIVVLFIFSSSSFAATNETVKLICNATPNKDVEIEIISFDHLTDMYVGKYILSYSSGHYHLFLLDNVDKVVNVNRNGKDFKFFNNEGISISVPYYTLSNGFWVDSGTIDQVRGEYKEQFIWRTNIYNPDGSTFFFTTALPSQMATVMEKAEMEQVMAEILKILGLILVVMVSLVGLRKAWKLLSTLFYQS